MITQFMPKDEESWEASGEAYRAQEEVSAAASIDEEDAAEDRPTSGSSGAPTADEVLPELVEDCNDVKTEAECPKHLTIYKGTSLTGTFRCAWQESKRTGKVQC